LEKNLNLCHGKERIEVKTQASPDSYFPAAFESMCRLKQLMPNKDQAGLEGKTMEVESLKLQCGGKV